MPIKESATIDVGYPIYGVKFMNSKTLVVAGGGGEGNHGIPNKINVLKSNFKVSDSKRRLQRFREITLPSNEDSPQCLDTAKLVGENEFNIILGCNQSSQLLKSMNINNNIRKYAYSGDEHINFVDAAQFEEEVSSSSEDYPKIIRLSHDNSIGAFMTSSVPSSIYIFNPDSLELKYKFIPKNESEIKDLALSTYNGASLAYVTASSIEIIDTNSRESIFSSVSVAALKKQLKGYILSKVKFIDEDKQLLIAAGSRGGKGAVLFKFNIASKKITQFQTVSKKFSNIVALDVTENQELIAIAGNDLSVTLINLSTLKVIQVFHKLHSFAITSLSFSPSGLKLASGSAANTLHVFKIPSKYRKGNSIIGTLLQYLFTIVLVVALGVGVQKLNETGQLQDILSNSKQYTDVAQEYVKLGYDYAHHYGTIGFSIAEEYARTYGNQGLQFIKEKLNKDESQGSLEASTLNDIVNEVTKNIDEEITKSDFNSDEFLQDKDNYITTSIGNHYQETPKVETSIVSSSEIDTYLEEPHVVDGNNDTSSEQQQPTFVNRESVLPESLQAMLEKQTKSSTESIAPSSETVVVEEVVERDEPIVDAEAVVEQQKEEQVSEPVVEQVPAPEVSQPVVEEEIISEEPVVEEPVVEESVVEESVVEEEIVEEPIVEEEIVKENPVTEQTSNEELVVESQEETVDVVEQPEEELVSDEPRIHADIEEPNSASAIESEAVNEKKPVEEIIEEVVVEEEQSSQEPVEAVVEVEEEVIEEVKISHEPKQKSTTQEEPAIEEPVQKEPVSEEPKQEEPQAEEVNVEDPQPEVVEQVIEEEIVEEVQEQENEQESQASVEHVEESIVEVPTPKSSVEIPQSSQVLDKQKEKIVDAVPAAEPKPEDVIEEKEPKVVEAVPESTPKVQEADVEKEVQQEPVKQPKVEQPKAEQPKAEQPKVEQPKAEQPKVEPVSQKKVVEEAPVVQEKSKEPIPEPSTVQTPIIEQVKPSSVEQPQQSTTSKSEVQQESSNTQSSVETPASSTSKIVRTKKVTRTIIKSKPTNNAPEKDEL